MRIAAPLLLILTLTLPRFSAYGDEPVRLGKTIGSLEFMGRTNYEQKELGYSLRYQTKDALKADVYVYDMGIRNLPEGITSHEVKKEMENVKVLLRKMEEMGKYRHVTELERGVRTFDDLNTRFLWARHSYEQSGGDGVTFTGIRVSDTFLLAHQGQFIKIRITTKQTDFEKDKPQVDQFVREVARQLEKGEQGGATTGTR